MNNYINSVSNMAISGLKRAANSKSFNNHYAKVQTSPAYAARFLVVANVSKDVFGYSLRAYQTLNNNEIPNDKKPFMAALDLMSGIVTGIAQCTTGFLLSDRRLQDKICNLLFGKENNSASAFKKAKAGFVALSTLIFSMIIAKRLIVPLISTPLASCFKNKFLTDNNAVEKITAEDLYTKQKKQEYFNYNTIVFKNFNNFQNIDLN